MIRWREETVSLKDLVNVYLSDHANSENGDPTTKICGTIHEELDAAFEKRVREDGNCRSYGA